MPDPGATPPPAPSGSLPPAAPRAGALRRLSATLGKPSPRDVTAGMATGLFSIPEGMAYASIGGFNPVAGLYAGIVPPILGSLAAPTVLMVTTLTSAIALTSQAVLTDAGLDPHAAGNVAALTVLVGVIMALMAVLRLGVVMSFVSNAVMTGFSTGIALSIITGVFKDATAYKPPGHNKLLQVWNWVVGIGHWQLSATLVAVATIAVWAAARLVRPLAELALLVSMVVVSIAVAVFRIDVETVGDIARIPAVLPPISVPTWSAMPHLFGGALAVAMVALAQAAGVSPSMPNPDGSRSNVNCDFGAQGLANLGGGFFSALPSGGSLSRTGVAAGVGARTRWAGVISGVFLAIVVLVCGSLAEHIPMPVIGGLIMVVGAELIVGKAGDIMLVLRTSRLSALAMVVTFAATTQLPLQQAIVLGAILSLLLYCVQISRQAELVALVRDSDERWRTGEVPAILPPGQVTVVEYGGASFFAELSRLEGKLPEVSQARGAVLVLVMRVVPEVPSSALIKQFHRYATRLEKAGGRLILAGVRPGLAHVLDRTGLSAQLGEGGVVPADEHVFGAVDRAVTDAQEWIRTRRDSEQ
ncbi:SulP family inorganic anion transporter [Nocardia coffeae]|uniref:SulP family inorganic anion transporter n=1 Tax=Nocardia coffeae TaxID=2873381 RepID=UPI0027DEE515|nr:SulP family inorganic anion transporter [Nocardia coffeae]